MGHSRIEIINDPIEGEVLISEGEARKGGSYIARITGTCKQYKYKREFVGWKERNGSIQRTIVRLKDLRQPFDLLEIRAGGSWKNEYRDFYLYDAESKKIIFIEEKTLREKLAEILKSGGVNESLNK